MARPPVKCLECGHDWTPRGIGLPARCPRCNVRLTFTDTSEDLDFRDSRPARTKRGGNVGLIIAALVAVPAVLLLGCCGVVALVVPSSRTKEEPLAQKQKPDEQPVKVRDNLPKELPKKELPKKQDPEVVPVVKADRPAPERLGEPDTEPVEEVVEFFFEVDRLQSGQVGSFKPHRGGASFAYVTSVIDRESMAVRLGTRILILSGIDTSNQERDKAVFLRGTWEVLGTRKHRDQDVWELTHLVDAVEVAKQEEKAPPKERSAVKDRTAVQPAKDGVLIPIVPTRAAVKAKGGTVQVKGYFRSDGTYVKPYVRSVPKGGGKR